MHIKQMTVTVSQAKEWLKKNTRNRLIRKGYVTQLCEAMERGEWQVSHQPIAIAEDGRLLDGQHRLLALLKSQINSLPMTVALDVDPSTFDVIDIGARRSHSDIFREDKAIMAPISLMSRLIIGHAPTPTQVEPVYKAFVRDFTELHNMHPSHTPKVKAAPIMVGAVAAILSGSKKEYVHTAFADFCNFEPKTKALVSLLRQVSTGGTQKSVQATDRYDLMVRAFTSFQEINAQITKVTVKDKTTRLGQIRDLYSSAFKRRSK